MINNSLTVDSLEFTYHRSPSSPSTPLPLKAFCFVPKTFVFVLLILVLYLWCDCLFEFLRCDRFAQSVTSRVDWTARAKNSDTLIILTPIFSICIMLRISHYCMIGSLLYCCCKTS